MRKSKLKKCSQCGILQPRNARFFRRNRVSSSDGLRSECKLCDARKRLAAGIDSAEATALMSAMKNRKHAPPGWSQDRIIDDTIGFYKDAKRLTKETGVRHVVDHIMPLIEGGAHHSSNLRVITEEANRNKGGTIMRADPVDLASDRLVLLNQGTKITKELNDEVR